MTLPYDFYSFIAITLFSIVHFFGDRIVNSQKNLPREFIYSAGGGIAISYVFIDLLPKLSESDLIVYALMQNYLPGIEKHVYIMALAGFILFYLVDKSQNTSIGIKISIGSYTLFNFLIGYAIADPFNPEVRPLLLFTLAMGLHLFVNDNALREKLGTAYQTKQQLLLVIALFLGWMTGYMLELPGPAVALVSAFIGGGVIMNVTRHELPAENPTSTPVFIFSAIAYTLILLFVGSTVYATQTT